MQPGCAKGRVVELSTVYGDMHYRDLLGVRYCIAVPNSYLKCMIFDIEKHSYGLIKYAHTSTHTYIHTYTETLLTSTCAGIFEIRYHFDIYFLTLFATHKRVVVGLIPMRNYTVKINLQVTVVND